MPENPAPVEEDDLGASIAANWDAQESGAPAESTPSPDTGAPPSPVAAESPPAASSGEGSRARGPDGKFIKAEESAKPSVDPAATPAPEAPAFRIPEKWPAHVKEKLAAIHAVNPEHAQFVLEQYEHFRREGAQVANRVQQQFKAFDDLLAPGRQARAMKNIDDTTYVRHLIAAGDYLDKYPVDGLRKLAQTYGIDLQQLANPEAGSQQPEIPEYVRKLEEKQQQLERFLASQHQAAQSHQLQEAASWIESFASQVDASGQPLYPYFDELLPEIVVNVQYQRDTGQPIDVHQAYERAKRMNDNVWLNEQRARSEAEKKKAEAQRLRDIEEAKRAGFTASGSGAATTDAVPDDLGELVSRNYDKFVRS